MKEYLFLLRGGKPVTDKTEAEKKAEMQAWGAYMGTLGKNGQFIGGLPLVSGGMVVTPTGLKSEPVNSGKEGIVGGYLIIKAENQQKATELAKACPHIANEGNIEVREIAPMPAME
ncbi:MAG TPA: YciI family protein [Puia sp.]|nr:YciI family protein [Puia sp.]